MPSFEEDILQQILNEQRRTNELLEKLAEVKSAPKETPGRGKGANK